MPTAAKRGGLRSLPPAPRQSSGFPTASASLSFPGCGRTCAAKRRRRAGTSSARKTRSRRIASSMPLTASGTTGSRTAGCRTLFEATPYELVRADPDQHCYDISPDGRFVAFGFDPAEEKKLDDEFDI